MAIITQNMILDKCGIGSFYQKRNDGTLAAQGAAGAVINGEFAPAVVVMGFTGQPRMYHCCMLDNMVKGGVYDITGKVAPVGTQVFLSTVTGNEVEDIIAAMNKETALASVTSSTEDGSFSFTNITHTGGVRYRVWIDSDVDYATATNSSLSAHATRLNETTEYFQRVPLSISGTAPCNDCGGHTKTCLVHGTGGTFVTCPTCSNTGYVDDEVCPRCDGLKVVCNECASQGSSGTLTVQCSTCGGSGEVTAEHFEGSISGQCPIGTDTVYISAATEDSTQDLLEANVRASAIPTAMLSADESSSASYNISLSGSTSDFVVWCASDTEEGLTATFDGTFSKNAPCLSGDTIITMADGSSKRLDKLEVGDTILAGSGMPTTVTKTAHGIWQPFHTLYYFEDGTVIDEIADHRFFNVEQGFWQKLKRWNIGEHAKRYDGEEIALVKVERIDEEAECFGVWTESHDHFANGLLGGEAAANVPFLEDATLEQATDMATSLSEDEIERMFFGGVL